MTFSSKLINKIQKVVITSQCFHFKGADNTFEYITSSFSLDLICDSDLKEFLGCSDSQHSTHNCFGIPIRGRTCTILLFLNRFKRLKLRCPNLWCHTQLSSLSFVAKHWCSIIWTPILKVLFYERVAFKISLQCCQTPLIDYVSCSLSSLSRIVIHGWEDYSSCWEHTTHHWWRIVVHLFSRSSAY